MRGLSSARLAVLSLRRRPARSIILLLLMTLIFTGLVAQSGVRATMGDISGAIDRNVGAGFTAQNSDASLARTDADALAKLPGVTSSAYETDLLVKPKGHRPVTAAGAVQLDPEFANEMTATATTNSQLNPLFQGKLFTLEQGEHLTSSSHGALVHKDFAAKNHLSVGSAITLVRDGKLVRLVVTGIFSGRAENPSGLPAGAAENRIFAAADDMSPLTDPASMTLARYSTASAEALPAVLAKAHKARPDLSLEDNSAQFRTVLASIAGVERLLTWLVLGLSAVSIAVLVLVLAFWARGRLHEIGILLSLGRSKGSILRQFLTEICALVAVAAVLALGLGLLATNAVSEALLARSHDPVLEALSPSASPLAALAALGVGALIVAIAVAAVLIPVFRRSPKSILASMS